MKALLLLCGHLEAGEQREKPLTPSEYNRLASWLHRQGLRPADLLGSDGAASLDGFLDSKIPTPRLLGLLDRGMALGLALEEWTRQGLSREREQFQARLLGVSGRALE